MDTFTTNNPLFQKVLEFFKKYGIFIAPVFLFLLFMSLLVISYTSYPSKKDNSSISPSPSSSETDTGSQQAPSLSPGGKTEGIETSERDKLGWSAVDFSESDLDGLNADKTTLSDGSIQYAYDSATPSRKKEIIVKDGIMIFQRTPVYNISIKDFTGFYGNPEYMAVGSQYWGPKAVTYVYFSQGFAFVANTDLQQIYEEMYFQPVDKNQFKSKYDSDLTGDLQPYHP